MQFKKISDKTKRMHNYYEVTLFTPVILLSALSVVGIILPGNIYFLGTRNQPHVLEIH